MPLPMVSSSCRLPCCLTSALSDAANAGDTVQPDGSLTGNPFIGSNMFALQGIDQYTGYYK